jgi:catechol 2,3-dioxygenase-like lactoylglutathione lyase family enzyme
MQQYISRIALVVADYDEAIEFYTQKLNFELVEDTPRSPEKRWVVIAPPGGKECCLLLAKAKNEEQRQAIGNQTGGRVFLFLYTDDFWRDYHQMVANGIEFIRPVVEEDFGIVSVFKDLYGNLWDFIEPKAT